MLEPLVDHINLQASEVKPKGRLIGGPLDIIQKHKTRGKEYFT
jgi:hypothetical protein